MLAVEILGWVGSALLVYSVLQTRILRLRLFNGVASALLVIFNAAIAVWPMVALNVTLTAINVFYIVRLLRGRHDSHTFEVVEISTPSARGNRRSRNAHAQDQPNPSQVGFLSSCCEARCEAAALRAWS